MVKKMFGVWCLLCACLFADAQSKMEYKVSFSGEEILIDGKAVQIRAGEIEPQRIVPEYWRHRIQMCKAMGCNAIASYFMWNDFERADGSFDFKNGNRDVAKFLQICKEEGMWVLFRPGPYVCGEWDFGGIPPRMLKEDIAIRSMDARYLKEAEKYLSAIADVAKPFLAKNGGPIILTQIENEYGSWAFKDIAYLHWIKDFWKSKGFGPFYMADGAGDKYLKYSLYPDKEVAVGFDPAMDENQWNVARKYNPGVPILSAETYPGWLRHWGEGPWRASDLTKTISWYMEGKKSFCIFVAHGGTSFGFTAGANDKDGKYEPDLTSYDYGSPINEQGRPTKEYFKYRKVIFDALGKIPPSVPAEIPSMSFPAVTPTFFANLRDNTEASCKYVKLFSFEAMGQNQGMAIYSTELPKGFAAALSFDCVADYAQVWVDGERLATIDRRKDISPIIMVPSRDKKVKLEIVVEAMGHINFGRAMRYDRKGIIGDVWFGGEKLSNWSVSLKPLTEESIKNAKKGNRDNFAGGHYRAIVKIEKPMDTFIDMSKWVKGTVYVNGRNIGRYWNVGPQLSLYCPAPFLKKGENVIDVVELELSEPKPIRGLETPRYCDSDVKTKNAANEW